MAKVELGFDGELLVVQLPDGTKVTISDETEASPWKGGTTGGYCVVVERDEFKVVIDDTFLVFDRIKAPIKQQIIKLKN